MTSSKSLPVSTEQDSTEPGRIEDLVEDVVEDTAPSTKELTETAPMPAAGDRQEQAGRGSLDMIKHIPVTMEILLGSTSMSVEKLVNLGRGAIIPLDRAVGEPVDVVVNGRLVARGQIVVTEENASSFSIKITEIVSAPGGAILS